MKKSLALLFSGIAIVLAIFKAFDYKSDDYIKARVVKLVNAHGSCSGEQIRAPSGVDYILTAAHCRILEENGFIHVIKEDGTELDRRIIQEDSKSDLLLLEGLPNLKGLEIASMLNKSEHIRTFTHGSGLDTYKTEGEVIQQLLVEIPLFVITSEADEAKCLKAPKFKLKEFNILFFTVKACMLSVEEEASTAMTVPGSSGGMVINNDAELVGVVSAGNGQFSLFVTLDDIHAFLAGY